MECYRDGHSWERELPPALGRPSGQQNLFPPLEIRTGLVLGCALEVAVVKVEREEGKTRIAPCLVIGPRVQAPGCPVAADEAQPYGAGPIRGTCNESLRVLQVGQ